MTISTTVTNEAMITMYEGILIESGITLRSIEMKIFEHVRTNMTATPIPSAFDTCVDTLSVGHIPSMIMNVGFSLKRPLVSSFIWLIQHLQGPLRTQSLHEGRTTRRRT